VGGVGVAALTGVAFGLLHAALTVTLGLSQHVSGLGITLLATSLASFAYRVSFPKVDSPPTIQPFAPMAGLPIPVLDQQTPLTLLALALVPLVAWLLMRTPLGLAWRMVGENPAAAEGQGLNVVGLRYGAVITGSALMGVAGSSSRCRPSTPSTSTWSTAAAGSAWRWWCSRRGGRARRCWGRAAVRLLRRAAAAPAAGRCGRAPAWNCPTSCT
jgi:ABC-type uncharacterized transport system permease subunit